MQIANFTPYSALIGGLLIGSAASSLLWLTGRIAGVSGIVSRLLPWSAKEGAWRVAFLSGLILGAAAHYAYWGSAPLPRPGFSAWLLVLGGLLVGFGTSFAGGCTSGHGVCGLGRLSLRSLLATLVFLGFGIATVFVVRHVVGIV